MGPESAQFMAGIGSATSAEGGMERGPKRAGKGRSTWCVRGLGLKAMLEASQNNTAEAQST